MTSPLSQMHLKLNSDAPTSVQQYISALEQAPSSGGYWMLSRNVSPFANAIVERAGAGVLATFHRRVLARLLELYPSRATTAHLPAVFQIPVARHVARMQRSIASSADGYFSLENDRFVKDLAICLGRLIPAGAELIDVHAGIARRIALRGGVAQLLRVIHLLTGSCGKLGPFCALHMHPDDLTEFCPQGWIRTYLRVAELLRAEPTLRGLFGTAWFYDPAVAQLSPHLAYLREYRLRHGAFGLDWGPTVEAKSGALSKSETRRRAFREGRYEPRTYYVVWPRTQLLRWANSMAAIGDAAP